jgi:hypothetical protein
MTNWKFPVPCLKICCTGWSQVVNDPVMTRRESLRIQMRKSTVIVAWHSLVCTRGVLQRYNLFRSALQVAPWPFINVCRPLYRFSHVFVLWWSLVRNWDSRCVKAFSGCMKRVTHLGFWAWPWVYPEPICTASGLLCIHGYIWRSLR